MRLPCQIILLLVLGSMSLLGQDTRKDPSSEDPRKEPPKTVSRDLKEELKTPFQVALINPIQVVSSEKSVSGVRFSLLYGRNEDCKGFDVGLVNHSANNFTGIEVGGVNLVGNDGKGLQYGFFNGTKGNFKGIQNAVAASVTEGYFQGVQGAIVSAYTAGDFTGLQDGCVTNYCGGNFTGLQVSYFVNVTKGKFTGVQIGLVNIAEDLRGIQIGLINEHVNGPLSVFPFINIGF